MTKAENIANLCGNLFVKHQIQLLSDLDLKKTPQLVELVEDTKVTNSQTPFHVTACSRN